MLNLFFFFFSLSTAYSGSVCLPKGWELSWTFTTSDTIEFVLNLPESISPKYQWVGIGFKYLTDEKRSMTGSDMNNIILGSNPVDSYAECNCIPTKDTDLSGTDDTRNAYYDTSNLKYTWERPLDSGDSYDKVYKKDEELELLWACGKVVSGIQVRHMVPDRGTISITLSEDFRLPCSDPIDLS